MLRQTTKLARYNINGLRYFSSTPIHTPICIIGGGIAGMGLTGYFTKEKGVLGQHIRVFEPSKFNHYQPGWTMVGAGIVKPEQSLATTQSMFPKDVTITYTEVSELHPEQNVIVTEDGKKYSYDQLIIACGISVDFDKTPGIIIILKIHNDNKFFKVL